MSKSGFDIKGIDALQKAITEAYSGTKARKIQREAVNSGADLVVEKLKENFEGFNLTGYSQEEIMHSNAKATGETVQAKIGWNGSHERWRLVHLNEFGYTKSGKQYTPKGFGVIVKTVDETKEDYLREVERGLRELL